MSELVTKQSVIELIVQGLQLHPSLATELECAIIAMQNADSCELVEALRLADAALHGANMNMTVVQRKVTAALEKAQSHQPIRECLYNHPVGTRCPACAKYPFKKGGAADFASKSHTILEQ